MNGYRTLTHTGFYTDNLPLTLILVDRILIMVSNTNGFPAHIIRVEGFNTPPFMALIKVLNPEYKYLIRTTYPVPLGRGC